MSNKVCIYAICKNEIQFVDKWIDSMSEADYIVVLDTGSTDGTFEKLKADSRITKVRQKVIEPWRFDVARNESMKLAPKDANILFCTDLDELLDPGWGELIRARWTDKTVRGHYQYYWSHTDTGGPGLAFWYDKMHTRDYKWYYPVHEVLGRKEGILETLNYEAADPDRVIDFGTSITLHHYPDNTKNRSNYLDLLELRVNENPDDAYSWYLLGREYGVVGDYDRALQLFEHTLEVPSIRDFFLVEFTVLGYMGDIYALQHKYSEAILCYNLQLSKDVSHREPYLCLAEIYNEMGMYRIAIGYVEEALRLAHRHFDWSERQETWNEKIDDVLSISYSSLGDIQTGVTHALRALKLAPNNERIRDNYLKMLSNLSD